MVLKMPGLQSASTEAPPGNGAPAEMLLHSPPPLTFSINARSCRTRK